MVSSVDLITAGGIVGLLSTEVLCPLVSLGFGLFRALYSFNEIFLFLAGLGLTPFVEGYNVK